MGGGRLVPAGVSELAPAFQYIDAELPADSPYLYGLHPNAEIGFLTQTSEKLFRTVLELQPRDSHAGDGAGATREEKVSGRGQGRCRAPCRAPDVGTASRSSCWSPTTGTTGHASHAFHSHVAGAALTHRAGRPA